MRILFLLLATMALSCCGQPARDRSEDLPPYEDQIDTDLEVMAVPGGYGYAIAVNGRKFILQQTVPAIQGNHAFRSRQQAARVGSWVATRIRRHETFSISLPVLQSLIGIENAQ